MHRLFTTFAATALLIIPVSVASAQFNQPQYAPRAVSGLVDQVHTDLNQAYSVWHLSGGDRGRLNHAEKELREFAQKWSNHHFDKGELDDAIGSIQHVLDNNRLPPDNRNAISEDVSQLRQMREAYDRHQIG